MQIIATDNNEDKDVCTKCGGVCCKQLPGHTTPSDFDNDFNIVEEALLSGRYAVDWWENYEEVETAGANGWYIRPATKGMEGELKDGSWGGECTFLTDKGCELSFENRPEGCRELIPAPDSKEGCYTIAKEDGKLRSARAWEKYDTEISRLLVNASLEY